MQKVGDPLLGATPAPPMLVPQGNASTGNRPTDTSANVPPIPTTPSSPTNATLASQVQPLGANRSNLSIPDPLTGDGQGWQRNAGPTSNAAHSPPRQPRVEPVPRVDSFTPTEAPDKSNVTVQPTPGIQPAGNWSSEPTPEQLKQRLEARGVVGQKLTPHGDGVHLICAVPNPNDPNSSTLYEVTAANYAAAAQAILHQLDQRPLR